MSVGRIDVLEGFERLLVRVASGDVPSSGYVVESLAGDRDDLYLGCSESGELAFLVESKQSKTPAAPLRLAALSADFGVPSELRNGDRTVTVRVSVLRCPGLDRGVADLFATVCASLTETLPRGVTEQEFAAEINRWSGLFWRLGRRVETDVVGLAGELAVIANSDSPSAWACAWHASPSDVLDFAFVDTDVTVEVKSTRGSTREHIVSLGQATGPGLGSRFFASVFVELNDSGRLMGDLVRELSDRLDDDARLSFWAVLTKVCGEALDEVLSRRLEDAKAVASIRFYRATAIPIPVIEQPLPEGVSSVSFASKFDLATDVGLDLVENEALSG